jgi:hypothetical protein
MKSLQLKMSSKLTIKERSPIIEQLNRFFMGVYSNAYPNRKFTHKKVFFGPKTFHSRYYDLFRTMLMLFNCRAKRVKDSHAVYLIGRIQSVDALDNFMTRMISETESLSSAGAIGIFQNTGEMHLTKLLGRAKEEYIRTFEEAVANIYILKTTQYLDKYAMLRQVKENEILDQTFFQEYIRENRLHNLKGFQWPRIN